MIIIFSLSISTDPNTLEFDVPIGSDKNYFIQNGNGAFHILVHEGKNSKVLVTSPAANSGVQLSFTAELVPKIEQRPVIIGKETIALSFSLPATTTIQTTLGSVRVIRDPSSSAAKMLKLILNDLAPENPYSQTISSWLAPAWGLENLGKRAVLKQTALNGRDFYTLALDATSEMTLTGQADLGLPQSLVVQAGTFMLTYSSTYKPLTPFTVNELLNDKTVVLLNNLDVAKKYRATNLLNGLRFLAYREKFLAGSWRFLTYFGRDTLISLRMVAPIVRNEVIEACIKGAVERLSMTGEISHEEDLGDQAYIDQIELMNKNKNFSTLPGDMKDLINVYNMVDENYLMMPLLTDYASLGGRTLFTKANENFAGILKNMNYVIKEASENDLIEIHKGIPVGDWRDSSHGLAFGRYPVSVNVGHVPSALSSIIKIMKLNLFNNADVGEVAQNQNLTFVQMAINNISVVEERYKVWQGNYKKFIVTMTDAERIEASNRHRQFIGLNASNDAPYPQGFLALSLTDTKLPIPIINSDSIFALLDNKLAREQTILSLEPFYEKFPNGLNTEVGNLITSTSMSPKDLVTPAPNWDNYTQMLANDQYHGEVIWSWQQILFKIALQRQVGLWCVNVEGQRSEELKNFVFDALDDLEIRLAKQSNLASELWTWKLENGKLVEAQYGAQGGDDTSNAEQLWSVAALGPMLWDLMIDDDGFGTMIWIIVGSIAGVLVIVGIVLFVYLKKRKVSKFEMMEMKEDVHDEAGII